MPLLCVCLAGSVWKAMHASKFWFPCDWICDFCVHFHPTAFLQQSQYMLYWFLIVAQVKIIRIKSLEAHDVEGKLTKSTNCYLSGSLQTWSEALLARVLLIMFIHFYGPRRLESFCKTDGRTLNIYQVALIRAMGSCLPCSSSLKILVY